MSDIASITRNQRRLIDTDRFVQSWSVGGEIIKSLAPVFDVTTTIKPILDINSIVGTQFQTFANINAVIDPVGNLAKSLSGVHPIVPPALTWSMAPPFDTHMTDVFTLRGAEILKTVNAIPKFPRVATMLGADTIANVGRLTSIARGFDQLTGGPLDTLGRARTTIDSSSTFRAAVTEAARAASQPGTFGIPSDAAIRERLAEVRDVVDADPDLTDRIEDQTPEMVAFFRQTSGLGYHDLHDLAALYDDTRSTLAHGSPGEYLLALFATVGFILADHMLPDNVMTAIFLGAEVFLGVGLWQYRRGPAE
ncbi:hypothetical protein [Labedella endophytica]|uniref:Uncharacterized protein n=1 Tax=Labedella endophytica TaxID=1523160 RepID=A0A3S0Y150_9MICO|nr:hypothetical protein [Labedella endophytica]RUR01820.1 hypothetical protein ELQ94_10235 [Labedella endophytica]